MFASKVLVGLYRLKNFRLMFSINRNGSIASKYTAFDAMF